MHSTLLCIDVQSISRVADTFSFVDWPMAILADTFNIYLHRCSIDIVASTESMVHASLMFISPAPLIARPKRPLIHSCIFVNRCADVSCNSCISGAEPKVSIGNYRPCADAQKS